LLANFERKTLEKVDLPDLPEHLMNVLGIGGLTEAIRTYSRSHAPWSTGYCNEVKERPGWSQESPQP
jgi:hypothetical protein